MVQKSFFGKFLLLWLGESVSAIGSGLTAFGLGVYVFQITGQATATAMTMLCGFLPMILMSVPAGALADRYDRRIMMMLGDGLSMIGLLIVLVGLSGGESTLWLVLTGLVVSSLFAGVMDPAYRASVTDLLSKKDYTRASGMIQLASASKYLISPVLAGVFLLIADVSLLVMIDIATVVLTVITTGLVRRNLINKTKIRESFSLQDFLAGWRNIKCVKGLWTLILVSAALVFFMSFIQVLATPLLLSITNEQVLGLVVTIGSFGMVLSSILIGLFPVNDNFHRTLSIALAVAGLAMVGFGASTNIVIITSMCFLFFACLPYANACLDYLVRVNISGHSQGGVWGVVSVVSQSGAIVAFAAAGVLADHVFRPLLLKDGLLSDSVGLIIGTGEGRGIGLLIVVAGLALTIVAAVFGRLDKIRMLEEGRSDED